MHGSMVLVLCRHPTRSIWTGTSDEGKLVATLYLSSHYLFVSSRLAPSCLYFVELPLAECRGASLSAAVGAVYGFSQIQSPDYGHNVPSSATTRKRASHRSFVRPGKLKKAHPPSPSRLWGDRRSVTEHCFIYRECLANTFVTYG